MHRPPTVSPYEPSIISENALPVEAITVSANALPTAPTAIFLAESNAEPDYIFSSIELTAWLNSHMYSGGHLTFSGAANAHVR